MKTTLTLLFALVVPGGLIFLAAGFIGVLIARRRARLNGASPANACPLPA